MAEHHHSCPSCAARASTLTTETGAGTGTIHGSRALPVRGILSQRPAAASFSQSSGVVSVGDRRRRVKPLSG